MPNYVNLDIRITSDPNDKNLYLVSARTKHEGPKHASFHLSLEQWSFLEPILVALDARREEASQHWQAIRGFGIQLFDSLFQGEVLILYDKTRNTRSDGIRIRLTLVPLELVVLPWELMFDKRQSGYLGYLCLTLQPKIVLVRCIDDEKKVRTAKYNPPLRILGMYAEPNGYNKLQYKEEQKAINEALSLLPKEQVSIEWEQGRDETLYKLHYDERQWNAFHFIGHGGFYQTIEHGQQAEGHGQLVFEDQYKAPTYISAEQICTFLPSPPTQLVVLNACETARGNPLDRLSSIAYSLASSGLPAVIAMQFTILDTAAVWFSKELYTALAKGTPIDEAVADARRVIRGVEGNTDRLDWASPILYMHSSGRILFSQKPPPTIQEPAVTVEQPPVTQEPSPTVKLPTITQELTATGGRWVGVKLPPVSLKKRLYGMLTILLIGAVVIGGVIGVPILRSLNAGPSFHRSYSRPALVQLNCVPGSITIYGSSSLQPLLLKLANDYKQRCVAKGVDATITPLKSDSVTGLNRVEDKKSVEGDKTVDIAASDFSIETYFAPSAMLDLVDYQIAAVIFAVIVNDQAGISNLDTDQLKKVYTDRSTKQWDQVGGSPNLHIAPYTREESSGTRVTFDRYLLGGSESDLPKPTDDTQALVNTVKDKAGAIGYASLSSVQQSAYPHVRIISIDHHQPEISETYHFWNIEHLYTKGPAIGLAKAFIEYMGRNEATNIINDNSFVSLNMISNALLDSRTD